MRRRVARATSVHQKNRVRLSLGGRSHTLRTVTTEWHPAACGAHCSVGQELMATLDHPDGHCVVSGCCATLQQCVEPERVWLRVATGALETNYG